MVILKGIGRNVFALVIDDNDDNDDDDEDNDGNATKREYCRGTQIDLCIGNRGLLI